MKKRLVALLCGMALFAVTVSGCGTVTVTTESTQTDETEAVAEETETEEPKETDEEAEEIAEEEPEEAEAEAEEQNVPYEEGVTIRVGGLKGPTSIGLLKLKDDAANGISGQDYEFTMATAADEITTALVKGELDIALIPANVSSVLFNKTEGKVSVIDINTLGVLYMVSGDSSIGSVADLEGKTIYLTGKGTTPDYVLQYVLSSNELLDKVTLEYKSEATEVAAVLAEDESAIGLLPQPFVTAACIQNENLSVVLDLTKLWDELQTEGGSRLLTGVTIVRNEFLEEHKDAVDAFLYDHNASVQATSDDLDAVAALAVSEEIIAKEPIAKKAIPNCNITCITGEEMKDALSGYLEVLYDLDPSSVGGALPTDEFYYIQ